MASAVIEITGEQAISITAPVAGAAPQSTIAAGEGYTGTISWTPGDASFKYDTKYTANVILTAAGTHKFAAGATAAVSGATVSGNTISADAAGNTLSFAAEFPATAADPELTALNAALAKVVDGAVSVDFGADQTAKTAAVKAYVEGKVNDSTITSAVEFVSGSSYKVTLTKSGKSVNKTISMTVNESANPDIAIVDGVKSTIEGHTFTIAQSAVADAAAAKTALQAQINALALNGVTATVNEGTYTAPTAGTSGSPAGIDGSYKATVALSKGAVSQTTAEITLTITAEQYVAPDQTPVPVFSKAEDTLTSAADSDASFTVSNASAYTGSVTVAVYTDSGAASAASGVTGNYADGALTLSGVTAGEYFVTFKDAEKAASSPAVKVTVKAYVAPIAPTKPRDPSNGTVGVPEQTTGQTSYVFTYKSTETGTPAMGTVTLKRADNQSFDLDTAAPADIVYSMTAAPAAGYKFVTWEKFSRSIVPTSLTITGTFTELNQYTASFAAVDDSAPKLGQMSVTTADNMSMLLQSDNSRGFDPTVEAYKTFLMPGATGFTLDMAIQAPASGSFDTVLTVDGTAVTPTKTTSNGLDTYSYSKAITTTSGDVKVVLTENGKTTTYTITVAAAAAKPQIVMDVVAGTSGVYDLEVNLENTIANEFTFSLKLDKTAFTGFTDNASAELVANAKAAITAQLEAGSAFEVVKAAYDSAENALVVAMASKDNSYVDCTAKTKIATLKFLTADNKPASTENLAKLTIDSTTKTDSALTDQRFVNFYETTADGKTGLILINLPNEMFIAGYVNSLMKADVQANIASVSIKKGGVEVAGSPIKPGADRSFAIKLEQGTYTVEITMTNYVTKTITVTGDTDSILGAVLLVAGDVNGDGRVDATDRSALIDALFTTVTPGAQYDLDGDGRVNGGDLGYLLANI